ncbi:MAG: sugar ABC transporter permease [Armatimonadota bacterium]|nr:sugar ABC transporter permease [Armatimonadota bacterium]
MAQEVAEQVSHVSLRVGRLRLSPAVPFVAPAVLVLLGIGIYPLLYSVWISLHTYVITMPHLGRDFIGLANYRTVLADSLFHKAVLRTLHFAALTLPIQMIGGISLALLLHVNLKGLQRFQQAMRLIMIVPIMMTPSAVGLIGRLMFNREFGIVNYLLSSVGINKVNWLGDPAVAMITIGVVDIWQWTPFVALVVLAGLSTVPDDLYEAAMLDSTAGWAVFQHVLFPYLRPALTAVLIIRVADILRAFDAIFVLTRGGPGVATEILSVYVQRVGFRMYDLGIATAMGFLLLIGTIVVSQIFIRFLYREIEAAV